MPLALGIDLGTTNSVAAVATQRGVEFVLGPRGERVHPSVVAYPEGGGLLVGADARRGRVRARKKAKLRVVSPSEEEEEFARSVERDLAALPTIDERDAKRR